MFFEQESNPALQHSDWQNPETCAKKSLAEPPFVLAVVYFNAYSYKNLWRSVHFYRGHNAVSAF